MGVVETKMRKWRPDSWRMLPAAQMPAYPDPGALAAVERELSEAPAIAAIADSARLTARIAEVAAGRAFILQGGDCAESFGEVSAERVSGSLGLFEAMGSRIEAGLGCPVIKIARIAGQF